MPVMDGYQLTKAIRTEEATTGTHIPIIAITANALHGEAERCLQIGMDDFIVKPIDLRAFRVKLGQWLPSTRAAIVEEIPHADSADVVLTHSSDTVFDRAELIRYVGDDEDLIHEVLSEFEGPAREIVDEISAAFQKRTAEPIGFAAHKLKSAGRIVGAKALGRLCEELEDAAGDANWAKIDAIAPQLTLAFEQLMLCIRSELKSPAHAHVSSAS
jgi:HPt (histidine-containing phosphotransfer) domain-containing protein